MKRRIALDLDGCFADFHKFVKEHTGEPYSPHTSWSSLELVPNLFLHLDVLPGAKEFFDYIWSFKNEYDIFVLTAIPLPTQQLLSAVDDKKEWVKLNLSFDIQVHTVLGGRNKKHWINTKGDILIDDAETNIKEWDKAGGNGILHTGDWEMTKIKFDILNYLHSSKM
jgi:5'(3')-deoxyribonucleotidase